MKRPPLRTSPRRSRGHWWAVGAVVVAAALASTALPQRGTARVLTIEQDGIATLQAVAEAVANRTGQRVSVDPAVADKQVYVSEGEYDPEALLAAASAAWGAELRKLPDTGVRHVGRPHPYMGWLRSEAYADLLRVLQGFYGQSQRRSASSPGLPVGLASLQSRSPVLLEELTPGQRCLAVICYRGYVDWRRKQPEGNRSTYLDPPPTPTVPYDEAALNAEFAELVASEAARLGMEDLSVVFLPMLELRLGVYGAAPEGPDRVRAEVFRGVNIPEMPPY